MKVVVCVAETQAKTHYLLRFWYIRAQIKQNFDVETYSYIGQIVIKTDL